jgi:uncharacterized protein (DUF302 family)
LTRHTTHVAIEHIVVSSKRSYDQVKATLKARMGFLGNTDELVRQVSEAHASWEQITQAIEERLGSSGFSMFGKVEQGQLLSLVGKPRRVIQYTVGNPLLAIQMIEHVPEVASYAPLRLAVFEGEQGATFVAYDSFSSLLSQYHRAEIAAVAQLVEQKLEVLVAEATGVEPRDLANGISELEAIWQR